MLNSIIAALVLIILSVLSFWLYQSLDEDTAVAAVKVHEPDYYLIEMVRHTMDEFGNLANVLRAVELYHYPDDDSMELAQPELEIYNDDDEPWRVVADKAWISANNEVILLKGGVEVWRLNEEGHRQIEILTSELRVLPNEKYAETDKPTTINSPTGVTRTIGMRANFSVNRIELLEQVRSHYEQKSKN